MFFCPRRLHRLVFNKEPPKIVGATLFNKQPPTHIHTRTHMCVCVCVCVCVCMCVRVCEYKRK